MKKIKNYIMMAAMLLTFSVPALVPAAVVYASSGSGQTGCGGNQSSGVANQVAGGASTASGPSENITCDPNASGNGSATTALGALAQKVVNIFSIIVGAASIIMIVYGGFRYITSGGSSDRVGAAKNTLIYAIVGLIIVGLAQILVHFVLSQAASTGSQFG